MKRRGVAWLMLGLAGCIRAPEIVMADRATALEEQAAGSFEEVEKDLALHAVSPRPVPLTPGQLEALGILPAPLVDHTEETEADRIDALLKQRCIGEGNDGLLMDTFDDCIGAADRLEAIALIDRTNHARLQLWEWMHKERPEISVEGHRKAWRKVHAEGVVCRGYRQRDDGKWEPKPC